MYEEMYGYQIYSDGKIYSLKRNKYLMHDINKNGYHQVTLFVNGQQCRKKVHRLVAYCFCNPPENFKNLTVDHIDEGKNNNNYTNLEWCSCYENNRRARVNLLNNISKSNSKRWENEEFRKRTSRNISLGKIAGGKSKGSKNPMFRYKVFDSDGNAYELGALAKMLDMSYSGVYRLARTFLNTGELDERILKLGMTIVDAKNKDQSTIEKAFRCENNPPKCK